MLIICCLFQGNTFAQTEIIELKNLAYTESIDLPQDSLQQLNLVVPQSDKPPLLIWIGGGAWSYGDRNLEMDIARQFAHEGIAVAAVGHRLSPAIWKNPSLISGIQHPAHNI